jgi:site-specific DNA-cytosine methylase
MEVDCLIINSYAGSLVLGAKAAGIPIRGSMEDSGYGIAGQRLNFPDLKFVDRTPWPADDLSNTIVIAHPPCSAFSNMNIVKEKRGTGTDAFECHRRVLDYALGQKCVALAIESVPGALEAAGSEYASYAEKYGYGHCFVLLNAVSFAVPQWRPRFWALFFREKKQSYAFSFAPTYRNVQSILNGEEATDPVTLKHVSYLKKKYDAAGFDFGAMMRSETQGGFDKIAKDYLQNKDSEVVKSMTGTLGLYRAGLPRKLDPTLWAPVVLGFSLWYVHDRPLNRIEYQRIMGFPDDYRWNSKMEKDFLTYLSKGVCPPVAEWVIKQLRYQGDFAAYGVANGGVLDLQPQKKIKQLRYQGDFAAYGVANGGVLDLQPQKKEVEEILRGTVKMIQEPVPVTRELPSAPSAKPRMSLEEFKKRISGVPKLEEVVDKTWIDRYKLTQGTQPCHWPERSHAHAVVKAILLCGGAATKSQIVDTIKAHNLIDTTMDVPKAVSWMLNNLQHKGKVNRE